MFAGWNYGLSIGTTLTPDNLAKYGIKTLVLSESCSHVESSKTAVSIDDTYSDLENLGTIFDVQAKADALVASMKAQIAGVQAKLAGVTRPTVFVYDSGTDSPVTAPGLAEPDALITLAGGTNIFHSLKQSWTSVSWEQVVKADPQCIVVNDYGTPTYEQKVQFLKTSPITRDLTAIRNNCFVQLDYGSLTPSPNNANAITAIAKALHPQQMG
ncbi:MAG: ABC transporter substrate-binding protein [Actinobacteria bacterium]|nr:ABC transporter substrate-binding protein [Actinomycetota bacterium]